jgi:hypothetical protein
MDCSHLTLRAALAADRLEDFIRQEESRGVELGSGSELERALALLLVQRGLRQDPLSAAGLGAARTLNRLEPLLIRSDLLWLLDSSECRKSASVGGPGKREPTTHRDQR